MKVLWIGDAVVQSGFSVVTHNICKRLQDKCEVVVFGVRYDGRTRHHCKYHIYPGLAPGDMYNFEFAGNVVLWENPDIIIIFNDLHIIRKYIEWIQSVTRNYDTKARVIPLFPVNLLPLNKSDVLALTELGVDTVLTYTDYSKNKVTEINPNLNIVSIYHGVDRGTYYSIPNAKQEMGLKNYFVVGNVNSNTYRKRLDLFLEGFAKFARGKPDVRCLIHANNKDISYDLPTLASDLGIADKVIISSGNLTPDKVNVLYNIMDVNTNTSLGEGFGLSLVEGAACGTPILCANHGNLRDIWGASADYIKIKRSEYVAGTLYKGDVIDTSDFVIKLDRFYEDRNYLQQRGKSVLTACGHRKFDWDGVTDKVFGAATKVNSGRLSIVS